MNVSISFSFKDGCTSSNTSFENHTAKQLSQEGKILIIGIFCVYMFLYQFCFKTIFAFGYGKNGEKLF